MSYTIFFFKFCQNLKPVMVFQLQKLGNCVMLTIHKSVLSLIQLDLIRAWYWKFSRCRIIDSLGCYVAILPHLAVLNGDFFTASCSRRFHKFLTRLLMYKHCQHREVLECGLFMPMNWPVGLMKRFYSDVLFVKSAMELHTSIFLTLQIWNLIHREKCLWHACNLKDV